MDDVREFVRVEKLSHGSRIAAIAEHADFHSVNHGVIRQGIQLGAKLGCGRIVDRHHALCILHG